MLWYVAGARVKGESRHTGPLTPPGNHIPVLFDQPALCGHPRCCAGAVREGWCHSVTLRHPLSYLLHAAPSKEDDHLLCTCRGRHRDVRPGLPSHLRPYAAIPATVPPSQALQHHPQHCANPGRQDVATPAVVRPLLFRRLSPRQRTDDDQTRAPALQPSKPPLDGHMTHHDTCQRQDSSGRLLIP
jgi:hypothetical protein